MGIDDYASFPVAALLVPAALRAPLRETYGYSGHAKVPADTGARSTGKRRPQPGATDGICGGRRALHMACCGTAG